MKDWVVGALVLSPLAMAGVYYFSVQSAPAPASVEQVLVSAAPVAQKTTTADPRLVAAMGVVVANRELAAQNLKIAKLEEVDGKPIATINYAEPVIIEADDPRRQLRFDDRRLDQLVSAEHLSKLNGGKQVNVTPQEQAQIREWYQRMAREGGRR